MVSTTKRAFGLGPLETIVNVGWGSLPTYVSVYCSANRTGLGSGTPHVATVTLSAAAIKRKCEIVLNTGATLGDPYNAYFKLVVIKVPGVISGVLFTLTLSGTAQQIDFDPPDTFCGIYEFEQTITWVGQGSYGPGGVGFTYERFHSTVRTLTPDGETTTEGEFTTSRRVAGDEYHTLIHEEYLSFYVGDDLHNTGLPCSESPTGKIEQYPFDVEVVVNPQKNHTVTDPGGPFFVFDPGAAVKIPGSGDFGGGKTSIWRSFLSYHITPIAPGGITNSSIDFKMQKALFAIQRKEKIIEVYPSTILTGNEPLTYSGGFRLNKGTPSPFIYNQNWDGTPPDFNDGIALYAGSPPPPVSWVPFDIPF